jgi:hypothetical protein
MTDVERLRDLEVVVAVLLRQCPVIHAATLVELDAIRRVGDRGLVQKTA